MNPFRDPSVLHFPQFERAFASSPSIDTIARTQPVEFSLGGTGVRSPILAGEARVASPTFPPSGYPHNNHRGPARHRSVAKQLDFSLSPREAHVSRSAAAVAGWYDAPARPSMTSAGGRRLAPRAAAPAATGAGGASRTPPTPPDAETFLSLVSGTQAAPGTQRHAAVQTDEAAEDEIADEAAAAAGAASGAHAAQRPAARDGPSAP